MIVKISRAFNGIFTIISYKTDNSAHVRNPRHSPAPSFATVASAVGRRLYARLMHSRRIKCFCGGAKTMLFKGKREAGNAPTATFQRDAAPPRARAPDSPHPRPHRRTAHLKSCCPSAEHARDPRKRAMPETCNPAPKIKSFQQNSRPARTIPIKSRPAACTSGGINNFPLK